MKRLILTAALAVLAAPALAQDASAAAATPETAAAPAKSAEELAIEAQAKEFSDAMVRMQDELAVKYARLIYNGFWFSPEREMLQAAIDHSQQRVNGTVRVKLYKGNANVIGRESADSLYDQDLVTFEEGVQAYDHRDAEGFIKLNALRLRVLARRDERTKD